MADPIRIVAYRREHAEAWRALNEAWLAKGGYALEAKDQAVLGDPEGAVLNKGGAIFMAERDGEAVGCCSVMRMADGGYEVGKMAVTSSALGLGIGRALLEACEAVAVTAGPGGCISRPTPPRLMQSPCTIGSGSCACQPSRPPMRGAMSGWKSRSERAVIPWTGPDAGTRRGPVPSEQGSRLQGLRLTSATGRPGRPVLRDQP